MKNVLKALLKSQSEINGIQKDGANPYHNSTYITLDSILNTVKPILNKHGLYLFQDTRADEDSIEVTTIIYHAESGEELSSGIMKMQGDRNPQKLASLVTYCRRIQLTSFLGINATVDDDGEEISKQYRQPKAQPKAPAKQQADKLSRQKELAYQMIDDIASDIKEPQHRRQPQQEQRDKFYNDNSLMLIQLANSKGYRIHDFMSMIEKRFDTKDINLLTAEQVQQVENGLKVG